MNDQIKQLLAYQTADMAVDAAEGKLRGSKERKTANQMKQRYEMAVEERKKLLARVDKAEQEVSAIAAEIDRLTGLASIDRAQDAPEDAAAIDKLMAEIEKLLGALKKQEERLKELQAAAAAGEKKAADYAAAAGKARDEFNTNKAGYEKLLAEAKPELEKLKGERTKAAAAVDAALLAKYEKLKQNKITAPVVPLADRRCSGCHMELPAIKLSELAKNGFSDCENCSRIMYTE